MPLWLPITIAAAVFQTWRTALQQRLRSELSVSTAGLVRYLYAVPVGAFFLATWCALGGHLPPRPTLGFLLGCTVGGLGQVIGTSLLIMAFGYRNFAVGTAYSKTDAVQAAIVAALLFHETLRPLAWAGILVGVLGVLTLSLAGAYLKATGLRPAMLLRAAVQPAALCGLGAGTGLAVAALGIKAAVNQLDGAPDPIAAALLALVTTNVLQTLMQGGYMAAREPASLRAAFTRWRSAMWVGVLSASGSACWFTAFALAPVALVRTVGQVEMITTLLFSRYYLHETLRRADIAGLALIIAGVILVLLAH